MKKIKYIIAAGLIVSLAAPLASELQLVKLDKKVAVADSMGEEEDFIAIALNPGSDETELNFTWYDRIGEAGAVYMAEKTDDADKLDETGFPKDGVLIGEAVTEPLKYTGSKSGDYIDYQINKATVEGLKADTEYVYRVQNGDVYSETYEFEVKGTIPEWSFYFATDPQLNNASGENAAAIGRWTSSLDKITEINPDASMMVIAGDLAHNGGGEESEYIDGFLAPERLKSLALGTTVGNHDQHTTGIVYAEHFNQPNQTDIGSYRDTPGDYWYTYNNALFINLTSSVRNDITSALTHVDNHVEFIKEAIEKNPDTDWRIIIFHEALFSGGWHATEESTRTMRNVLVPLLDEIDVEYGIDLVLNGHEHYYSRTYLMQGLNAVTDEGAPAEVTDPDGIYYITGNTASGVLYNDPVSIDYDYMAVHEQQYTPNISNIDISTTPYETSLRMVTYRTAEGNRYTGTEGSMSVVDDFTIKKTTEFKKMGAEKTLTDEATGIKVKVPNVFSQDEVKVEANVITSGDEFNKLAGAANADAEMKDYKNYSTVYDVDTTWCGNDIDFMDNIEVFIPLPEVKEVPNVAKYAVYSLSDSGYIIKEKATLTTKDDVQGFVLNTKKTGTYAVTVAGEKLSKPDVPTVKDETVQDDKVTKVIIKKIKSAKKKITLKPKKKYKLNIKITPNNATNKTLKYTSSNKKVAKVSKKGVITAVKKGKSIITVQTTDGSKKKIKITVKVKR